MDTTKHNEPTEKVEAQANLPSPSSSSSPSHEFSFSVSLHNNTTSAKSPLPPPPIPPPPVAIDLSPADDIFFHGHLLPLHLLSHLPASPRSSTHSIDRNILPIRDLTDNQMIQIPNRITSIDDFSSSNRFMIENHTKTTKTKPKSLSLFRWRKGNGDRDRERDRDSKQSKKRRFEVSRVLKKYLSMIRPLLFFRGRRENLQYQRQQQPYNSYSGNLSFRRNLELSGRKEFSAPASMRVSPSNSGHLAAPEKKAFSGGDGTMEELQAAIQAAIAHCKNSIAVEEKSKC